MSGTEGRALEDELAAAAFAAAAAFVLVGIPYFGSRRVIHTWYGPLHDTLRSYDATAVIVPAVAHIHLPSAYRLASVYAADVGRCWRFGFDEPDQEGRPVELAVRSLKRLEDK
jgi:hypothetical protein